MAFFFEFLMMALAPVAVWLVGEWMERRRARRARERAGTHERGDGGVDGR